jgi:hypothetical protein
VAKILTFPTVIRVAFVFSGDWNSLKKELFFIIFVCGDVSDFVLKVILIIINPP